MNNILRWVDFQDMVFRFFFDTPYQKSVDTFKFLITQVSHIIQQKKVNTISHVR